MSNPVPLSTRTGSSPPSTSPSSASSQRVTCPPNAAPWFAQNFAQLDRHELGASYARLLERWLALEAANNFEIGKGSRIKMTVPKPTLLKDWIQAGRASRAKRLPHVGDVDGFARSVWAWWVAMQPSWRKVDATGSVQPRRIRAGDSWGASLDVRGQNGMLSVVACLCWWGLALKDGMDESRQSWVRLVHDVASVCEQMSK
ncbi:hypothetical protein EV715DRAFT_211822 [Schizophyllum commune]